MANPSDVPGAADMARASIPLGLSLLGGLVKWARSGRCSVWQLLVNLLMAGFVGALAHLALSGVDVAPSIKAAVTGVCGYSAGDLLTIASRRACALVSALDPSLAKESGKDGQ